MKNLSILIIFSFLFGCGGNSEPERELFGTWRSNCHELVDVDDNSFLGYSMSELTFDESTISEVSTYFDDGDCYQSTGPGSDEVFDYSIGGILVTDTDDIARRITIIYKSLYGPIIHEFVYLVENESLYFGIYQIEEPIEIDYSIAYIRE